MFLVDAAGTIKFSNSKGEHLLRQERVVKGNATGHLCFTDARNQQTVTERIRRTVMRTISDGPDIIPLHAVSKKPLPSICHNPVDATRRADQAELDAPHAGLADCCFRNRFTRTAKGDIIAMALNVTLAEARLALALFAASP